MIEGEEVTLLNNLHTYVHTYIVRICNHIRTFIFWSTMRIIVIKEVTSITSCNLFSFSGGSVDMWRGGGGG